MENRMVQNQFEDHIEPVVPGAKTPAGDWRRLVCLGCRPEPSLYTAIWARRRAQAGLSERLAEASGVAGLGERQRSPGDRLQQLFVIR